MELTGIDTWSWNGCERYILYTSVVCLHADMYREPYLAAGASLLRSTANIDQPQARKHNLTVTCSNYSSIRTYNETGYTDYRHLQREYAEAYRIASREAGRIMTENLQDQTTRTGLALAGWRPRKDDSAAQAVEWWNWGTSPATSRSTSRST